MKRKINELIGFIKDNRIIFIIVVSVMFGSVILSLPTILWHDVAFFYYLAWFPLLIQWILYYISMFTLGIVVFSLLFTVVSISSNGMSYEAKKRWLLIFLVIAVLAGLVALFGFIVYKAQFIPPFTNKPFVPVGFE